MDDRDLDLVAQLCTRIGMIMEDSSVIALTVAGHDRVEREFAIKQLEQASAQIGALMTAARFLVRKVG